MALEVTVGRELGVQTKGKNACGVWAVLRKGGKEERLRSRFIKNSSSRRGPFWGDGYRDSCSGTTRGYQHKKREKAKKTI